MRRISLLALLSTSMLAAGCSCGSLSCDSSASDDRDCAPVAATASAPAVECSPELALLIGPGGPDGPQGAQGEQGPQGPQGAAGNSLPGPRGADGPSGAQGPAGPRGPSGILVRGPAGPAGGYGPQGARGPSGTSGARGADTEGYAGPAGGVGPAGPQGARGESGPQGPALVGPSGPAGRDGSMGQTGMAGGSGPRGESAVAIAGPRGNQGSAGQVGQKGESGTVGVAGVVDCWTTFRKVAFERNSASIPRSEQYKITEIAAYLRDNPTLQIGLDNAVSTDGNNDRDLANRRVNAIRDSLVQSGVSRDKIQYGAIGDPSNRREQVVEVLFSTGDGSTPVHGATAVRERE